MSNEKNENIKKIINQYGKDKINFSDQVLNNKEIPAISSGSYKIDEITGINGIPVGRIIEIYGNESSGKTTLALEIAKSWQDHKAQVAYIDAEHSLNRKYLTNLNINLNKFIIAEPDYGEQAFAIIESLIKTNMVDLIIIDSVAALIPKSELEVDVNEQNIGMHARLMSKCLRRIQSLMYGTNVTLVFINQLREKIGILFGNPETTPGGRALKFYSSIRMEIKRTSIIKNSDNKPVGIKSKVTVVKNKLAPPLSSTEIDILFEKGIDKITEEIDSALKLGIIQKNGSWYSWQNNKICQGKELLYKLWSTNSNEIIKSIKNDWTKRNKMN